MSQCCQRHRLVSDKRSWYYYFKHNPSLTASLSLSMIVSSSSKCRSLISSFFICVSTSRATRDLIFLSSTAARCYQDSIVQTLDQRKLFLKSALETEGHSKLLKVTLALTAAAASADAAAVARFPSPTSRSTLAFLSPSPSASLCPSSVPSFSSFSFSPSPNRKKNQWQTTYQTSFPVGLKCMYCMYLCLNLPCPLPSLLLVPFLSLLPFSHSLSASPLLPLLHFCCPGQESTRFKALFQKKPW